MIHVVDFEKTAFSTPFRGVSAPSGPQISAESGRGRPLSGTRETWLARFVAAFAIPHPPSAICHLPFAICHLPFLLPHSPFRIPHSAFRIFSRAEGAARFLAPGKPGWPPTSTWPLFSRSTPHASRPTTPGTGGVGPCADPPPLALPDADRRFGKDRTGPDLDERRRYFQYVTEPGDSRGKINPFRPTRCRPTVKHSLAAGDAQHQWLQAAA